MSESTRPDPDDRIAEREGITPATEAAEHVDEETTASADRLATPEEERVADQHGPLDPSVVEHEKEMTGLGAEVKGEGQIEP